ncbi:hypothetical protein SDC9_113754 [bioreactor metagenome]|uniref:Uncharacterized protein n=1 Tax=bioreactor metagenome TaxID=1076179 RepID=A0A645BNU2_9ZZZZ
MDKKVIAINKEPRIPDIHKSVRPAFLLRGSLKAVIPLEMASTPVNEVVPFAKARNSKKAVSGWTSSFVTAGGSITVPNVPAKKRTKPTMTIKNVKMRKK